MNIVAAELMGKSRRARSCPIRTWFAAIWDYSAWARVIRRLSLPCGTTNSSGTLSRSSRFLHLKGCDGDLTKKQTVNKQQEHEGEKFVFTKVIGDIERIPDKHGKVLEEPVTKLDSGRLAGGS
ncbi:hypothetical protein [Desulfogranum mediterraneum]|uniref:hypothetical protein n=1 Tax=Desulfogranum mediterraneum TaxID=160661 RepID=UPI00129478E0|nr:hypothetical protein [Desulfogranum mediterraneum]